jgi:hypothetical protein
VPVVDLLSVLQSQVWPGSPERMQESLKFLLPALQARPVLTSLALGVLAGACEEILYRGPIQAALVRRLPTRAALLIGAALFAAAHMDAHGFPIRTLLGLVLGYVVWRGKSVFPAMVLHGVYDIAQLGRTAWVIHTRGPRRPPRWPRTPPPRRSTPTSGSYSVSAPSCSRPAGGCSADVAAGDTTGAGRGGGGSPSARRVGSPTVRSAAGNTVGRAHPTGGG